MWNVRDLFIYMVFGNVVSAWIFCLESFSFLRDVFLFVSKTTNYMGTSIYDLTASYQHLFFFDIYIIL